MNINRNPAEMERMLAMCFLLTSIVNHLIGNGKAAIILKPTTTEAVFQDRAIFNCSSDLQNTEIHWFHYSVSSNSDRQLVYGYEQFAPNYKRFQMEKNISAGVFSLVIPSVTLDDAGRYECQDDHGRGEKSAAELIVLDTSPVCLSVTDINETLGENNYGFKPEKLLFSCIVQYKGNEVPHMQWRKLGYGEMNGLVFPPSVEGDKVAYNISIPTYSVRNLTSFECFASRGVSTKSRCQSGVIMVTLNMMACPAYSCDCKYYVGLILAVIFIVIPLVVGVFSSLGYYFLVYKPSARVKIGVVSGKQHLETLGLVALLLLPFYIGVIAILIRRCVVYILKESKEKDVNLK